MSLSWKLDTPTIGLAMLSAAEVPNFLAGLLPSLMTINRFAAGEEDRIALRRGEVFGSILSVGIGVGATVASGSWWPLAGTLIVLGILLFLYESGIQNPSPTAKAIDDQ